MGTQKSSILSDEKYSHVVAHVLLYLDGAAVDEVGIASRLWRIQSAGVRGRRSNLLLLVSMPP